YVYIGAGQDLKVSLLNQYGEKMSLSGATVSVVPSAGTVSAIEKTTTVKVNTSLVEAGKTLFVFVYDPTSMLSAQATVSVNTNPIIKGITFGAVTIKDSKDSIFEGTTGHIIEVMAVDQYGNPYTFAEGALPGIITLISSNTDVISPAAVTVNADGNFVFATPNDGTATLTAIVPTEGVVAQSAPIVVLSKPVLSSVSIEGASGALYVNETGTLVAAGVDQYGAAATIVSGTTSGVTFQSTKPGIVPVIADGKVKVTPTESGTAKVFYYFKGNLVGSFDLTVYDEAVPTLITAVDLTNAVQTGVTVSVTSGSATVVDQYGREIDLDGTWNIELTYADADNFDVVTSASMTYTITANTNVGSDAFKIVLTDDGVVDEGSVYSFTLTNVAASKIVTVEMELPALMYGGTPADGSALGDYDEEITFVGKTEDGQTVTLLLDNSIPEIIDIVTLSSSTYIDLTDATLSNKGAIGDDDATLTVKAWRNGVIADSGTITIASAPAVASTLTWIKDQDMSNPDSITVVVKNQYGVECNLPAGQWYSSNTAVWAFEGTTSGNKSPDYSFVNTSTTDDKTVTISYITADGKLFITGSFTIAKNTPAES
ncbi:MAG: hypothetical protein JXQ23_03865, partial [Clostridia bacterium]|nr:hypothetical protein [Clostridia bacterium]